VDRRALAVAVSGVIATAGCGGSGAYVAPLAPAGATGADDQPADDATGQLAQASVKFTIGPAEEALEEAAATNGYAGGGYDEYGGYQYGGGMYGGGMYGGESYAGYVPNAVGAYTSINRQVDYTIQSLANAGSIAGTVTWADAPGTRRLSSPCGEIENPTLRLGPRGEVGGAVVYLDGITQGRPLAIGTRPLVIGGTIEKIDCALRPTAQVLSPAPAPVTIHNDARRDVMVVRGPGTTDPVTVQLAPGGHRQVGVVLGVTTVADEAGAVVPAWIVAPGHPYFALTDDRGRFQIGDVVPGTYKLVVWHPPVVTGWRDGKPQYGAPTIVTRTVKVSSYATARADVALK
jgi:hypothetical protein